MDPLNEDLKEEKFNNLYLNYLHKLLLLLEIWSVKNEINFYASLLEIVEAKPTPHLFDQKIDRLRALRNGDENEWLSLLEEVEKQDNQGKLKVLFEKAKQKKG